MITNRDTDLFLQEFYKARKHSMLQNTIVVFNKFPYLTENLDIVKKLQEEIKELNSKVEAYEKAHEQYKEQGVPYKKFSHEVLTEFEDLKNKFDDKLEHLEEKLVEVIENEEDILIWLLTQS